MFQLVDVRRQIFEALPPTPLLQLLHLFTREAKTASVLLATSLVAGEHFNAKSCARKPGIAVLSEAITAYTSDIIRYHQISSDIIRYHQISDQSFSIFSQQQIPLHLHVEYQTKATARSLGKFQRQVAETQAFSHLSTSNTIEMNMDHVTTGASTPSSFAGARSHGWTL